MKNRYISLIAAFIFCIGCGYSQNKKLMNIITVNEDSAKGFDKIDTSKGDTLGRDISRPSYRIYVRSSECQFDVFIDDVNVLAFKGAGGNSGGINGELPINNVILQTGYHDIVVKMRPITGQSNFNDRATVEVELYRVNTDNYEDGEADRKIFVIDAVDIYSPDNKLKGLDGLPYFEFSKNFEVKLPFAIEGWTKSVNLEKEDSVLLKSQVEAVYRRLHAAIDQRQPDSLKSWMQDFQQIRNTAFYFDQKEAAEEWNDFAAMITNSNYGLAPLPEHAFLHFYANGKLVTLTDENNEGIIKLQNKKDPKDVIHLEFKFHRKMPGLPLTIT